MLQGNKIERVLLHLSDGSMQKQKLEQELGYPIPQILFEKKLVTPPDRKGYVNLTKRGVSSLSFLTSIREMSILELELEQTLTTLEKMEEELINLGFYDVITTPEDLAKKLSISDEESKKRLEELSEKRYVLRIRDNNGSTIGYRSRIAEITRLISHLKQRFSEDDIYDSPSLVSSVKLRVKDRYVTRRSKPVEELMTEIEGYTIETFKESWNIVKDILINWLNHVGIEKVSNFQRIVTLNIFNILQRMHVGDLKKGSLALVAETGAGKTEAYFLPFVTYLLLRKIVRDIYGKRTRLVVVYPRVALSFNQLARFTKYVYQINKKIPNSSDKIYVGIDNESIPHSYDSLEKTFDKYYADSWKINDKAYFNRLSCPVLETLTEDIKFECGHDIYYDGSRDSVLCDEGHELPIKLFKEDVYGIPDIDIVIMTPNTLMRRLFEDKFIDFLERTDILLFVLDECHLYSSLPGSNAALAFRRLLKLTEEIGIKVLILGVSATMASAEDFFKELIGYKPQVIRPEEYELERRSVEYYLFVKPETVSLKRTKISGESKEEEMDAIEEELKPIKPLSTMIQTLMCIMHNMRRTHLKNKGLGFVDSIDTLHRWYSAQDDAEKRRLFELRTKKNEQCEKCKDGPILSCPIFRVGECWYFAKFDELSIGLDRPVKSRIYYSERREELLEDADCILSTSALEVGYDDPRLITFFQYKGPRSFISFAQRKGRVARSPEDRPINVLVLSPYSSRDNFIFVNNDHLLNSEYNETPLNYENYFAQSAHAKAAIIDYVAYKNQGVKITYETPVSKVRSIISETLQREEESIMKWVGGVASIYAHNIGLFKGLMERLKEMVSR